MKPILFQYYSNAKAIKDFSNISLIQKAILNQYFSNTFSIEKI